MTSEFTPEFWDERYAATHRVWSGLPNAQLVTQASGLEPGSALDVGCGEGADAVWLASRGWQVTAMDVSQVALDKAAEHGQAAGVVVQWLQRDLMGWASQGTQYDLVSAQFMYLPQPHLRDLYRALGRAVAPGGTLLLVGHHPMDPRHNHPETGEPEFPDVRWTPEEAARWIASPAWARVQVSTVERTGHLGLMHDAIVKATKRG
jgi:SAM-dependent methyltransferase